MTIPKNNAFWDYNLKFYRMIDMDLKYDNIHKNELVYVFICFNNN